MDKNSVRDLSKMTYKQLQDVAMNLMLPANLKHKQLLGVIIARQTGQEDVVSAILADVERERTKKQILSRIQTLKKRSRTDSTKVESQSTPGTSYQMDASVQDGHFYQGLDAHHSEFRMTRAAPGLVNVLPRDENGSPTAKRARIQQRASVGDPISIPPIDPLVDYTIQYPMVPNSTSGYPEFVAPPATYLDHPKPEEQAVEQPASVPDAQHEETDNIPEDLQWFSDTDSMHLLNRTASHYNRIHGPDSVCMDIPENRNATIETYNQNTNMMNINLAPYHVGSSIDYQAALAVPQMRPLSPMMPRQMHGASSPGSSGSSVIEIIDNAGEQVRTQTHIGVVSAPLTHVPMFCGPTGPRLLTPFLDSRFQPLPLQVNPLPIESGYQSQLHYTIPLRQTALNSILKFTANPYLEYMVKIETDKRMSYLTRLPPISLKTASTNTVCIYNKPMLSIAVQPSRFQGPPMYIGYE